MNLNKKYKDYRSAVQKILDEMDASQSSLSVGATAICEIIKMSELEESSVDVPESKDDENDYWEKETFEDDSDEEDLQQASLEDRYGVTDGHRVFKANRLLNGTSLIDPETDEYVARINEQVTRNFGIENGNLVEAIAFEQNDSAQIFKVLSTESESTDISEFKYALVKRDDDGHLFVTDNASGEALVDYAGRTYYNLPDAINAEKSEEGFVSAGDVVDLAWYKDEPERIIVRWIHRDDKLPEAPKSSNTYRKNKPADEDREEKDPTQLDFDLLGRNVTIVIGDELRKQQLQDMIKQHNGECNVINGFKHSDTESFYKSALQNTNLVVMVQSLSKHSTSKILQKYVDMYDLGFAIADSAGLSSVERAVYRAFKGLPAYETSTQPIQYPLSK